MFFKKMVKLLKFVLKNHIFLMKILLHLLFLITFTSIIYQTLCRAKSIYLSGVFAL